MANKQIGQIRYYANNSSANSPAISDLKQKLQYGTAFDDYYPITQLGIQALPGTKFYLNSTSTEITSPIIIGSTGIYELNIEGISEITNLVFDGASLNNIGENNQAYLIVDIVGSPKRGDS